MDTSPAALLRAQIEPLAALSLRHLTMATRDKLACDELSVNAYPTEYGGFLYVGTPRHRIPAEQDLATIFEVANQAGVAWLKFDVDAALIEGLPIFGNSDDH